jgi:hypothetical protein
MRTTFNIPDPLYRPLKSLAELILRGLQEISMRRPRKRRKCVSLPLIRSTRLATLEIDNARIFEVIPFP